jgi:hypothetical protein
LAAALRFADEAPELDADERLRALVDERLLPADDRLLLAEERLDPLDFLDLPPELPLLRRSAIVLPSSIR